jgi:hypothetical protein
VHLHANASRRFGRDPCFAIARTGAALGIRATLRCVSKQSIKHIAHPARARNGNLGTRQMRKNRQSAREPDLYDYFFFL